MLNRIEKIMVEVEICFYFVFLLGELKLLNPFIFLITHYLNLYKASKRNP